ncbi:CoA-binding protein [Listeria monocytogenes]|nr:CoA-binding protein [Listeria monocytogenes]GAT38411.1 CoA-binding protein [Listeria monocytogenes]GAT40532.1 CoA-binding protein [Listeria monocytogenes]
MRSGLSLKPTTAITFAFFKICWISSFVGFCISLIALLLFFLIISYFCGFFNFSS